MRFTSLLALVGAAEAAIQGFNYGSTFTDGSAKQQSDYEADFNRAKSLQGTSGWSSARIYTLIQAGTTNTPSSAIPAAINSKTTLLLGLWASAGQAAFTNELDALTSAINQYGTAFTNLIDGISVGSEDLYRITPTGIENNSGVGASPDTLVSYINQLRSRISGTSASGKAVGHVDTWTAWVNGSNTAVISALDFLGFDGYPYFQTVNSNGIDNAENLFWESYNATVAASQGKPVWVTETGWPVSGPQENLAVASVQNAQTYWDEVGCALFGKTNTWWYTLQDSAPTTPSPSFGIVGSDLSSAPLYNLTCASISSSTSTSASSSASTVVSSPTASTSAAVSSTVAVTNTPGPEASSTAVATAASSAVPTTLSTQAAPAAYSTAGGSACPAPSSAQAGPSVAAGSTAPAVSQSSGSACAANLNGVYEYPHLIVPVDSSKPSTAFGTSYNGTITPSISSIFNFDIPASYAGKTCSLVFLFPEQAALQTSAYSFNGEGGISVSELSAPATEQTTFDSVPAAAVPNVGSISSLKSGNSYVVASHSCSAGQRIAFEFSSTGGLNLNFFEDYNPSPLGAYITVC